MVAKNAGHVLFGVFKSMYKEANSERPPALREYRGNAYRDAAMFKRIAEEIGEETVIELLKFYFAHRSKHEVGDFIFNYDELLNEVTLREREQEHLERVREITRKRIEELGVEL